MLPEIGSNFWICHDTDSIDKDIDRKIFNCEFDDSYYTSTGRSAISFALDDCMLNYGKRALLPVFTCETVIQPFLDSGYEVSYYEVSVPDLKCDVNSLLQKIQESTPSVILFHNYFGFETLNEVSKCIHKLREMNIVLIEDITQCLYSRINRLDVDYTVGSFRKWFGIPDGGFVLKKHGRFRVSKNKNTDVELEAMKLEAMNIKYNYLFKGVGSKEEFLQKFAKAEQLLDSRRCVYQISNTSRKLQGALDIHDLSKKRRSNFSKLLNGIEENYNVTPAFEQMHDGVVPLYFPVWCKKNRSEIQTTLREERIYAPVIWPIPPMITHVSENTQTIYDRLLCIPCDQRYDTDDMSRIVDVIRRMAWEE